MSRATIQQPPVRSPAQPQYDVAALGLRIKHAREQREMLIRVLAQRAGYSVTHLSQIERGHTCPTIGALARIANALGHDLGYFLEGDLRPEVCAPGSESTRRYRVRSRTTSLHVTWLSSGIAGGRLVAGRVTVGPHAQPGDAAVLRVPAVQLCHVLAGTLLMRTHSGEVHLGPGDSAMIRPGLDVYLRNPGPGDAELMCLLVSERPGGTPASQFVLVDAPTQGTGLERSPAGES